MITFSFLKNVQAYFKSILSTTYYLLKIIGIWSMIGLGGISSSISFAQEIITQRGQATVSILNANIAQAEANAQLIAKQKIILSLLKQYLPPQTLSQGQAFLEDKILNNPDRFIESIQIISGKESRDRQSFSIILEARVFPSRLISTIKNLNFALINDPIRRIALVYNVKNPFWNNRNKINFQLALNRVLTPFRIRIQQTLPFPSLELTQTLPQEMIEKSKHSTTLFFDFHVVPLSEEKTVTNFSDHQPIDKGSIPTSHYWMAFRHKNLLLENLPPKIPQHPTALILKFKLYETSQGKLLKQDSFPVFLKNWEPGQGIVQMLEAASLQWNDIISKIIAVDQQKGNVIQIKIQGLVTPTQELHFIQKEFEQDINWKQFNLHTIAKAHIIYQGYYTGSLRKFTQRLKKQKQTLYKIRQIKQSKNLLDINVQWIEKSVKLRKYRPVKVVERWVKRKKASPPQRRVPQSDVKKTYILPQSQTVYDLLRSRGDSTSYEIRWLKPYRRINIEWHLISKTNLNPILSIHDQNRNLIKQVPLDKNTLQFNFKPPQNQKKLFIRVSDQIGYIGEESGSHLFVHYILKADFQ